MKLVFVLAALLFPAVPVTLAADARVSGTIVSVDPVVGVMTLEEFGAGRGAEPAPRQYTVALTADTRIELVQRVAEGADGWPRGYAPSAIPAGALRPGDFATVTVEPRDGVLRARSVSVVRPDGGS